MAKAKKAMLKKTVEIWHLGIRVAVRWEKAEAPFRDGFVCRLYGGINCDKFIRAGIPTAEIDDAIALGRRLVQKLPAGSTTEGK